MLTPHYCMMLELCLTLGYQPQTQSTAEADGVYFYTFGQKWIHYLTNFDLMVAEEGKSEDYVIWIHPLGTVNDLSLIM